MFLDRLRQEKARFMIVFGLEEEDHEAIGPGEQQTIDEYNVKDILDEMKQKDLKREVLATERHGIKITYDISL